MPPPTSLSFSTDELTRYSRQLALPGVGLEGQSKLRDARVLLIGLGGLGSPVALYLAAAGVGTLGLAEMDRLEVHNLHRQILHDTPWVGISKLASAYAHLSNLNPAVALREHPDGLTPANARALFSYYDLIVDGADNFPARYLASDAAARVGRPLVHGSIFQFEGQVSVFDPARGAPCYRCLFPNMPAAGEVPNCAEAGVFGALCGVIGSAMAMEALKIILGLGEPLRGRLFVFDALSATARNVQIKRDPQCPCCGPQPDARIAALDPELYVGGCAIKEEPHRRSANTNERFLRDLNALHGDKNNMATPLPDRKIPRSRWTCARRTPGSIPKPRPSCWTCASRLKSRCAAYPAASPSRSPKCRTSLRPCRATGPSSSTATMAGGACKRCSSCGPKAFRARRTCAAASKNGRKPMTRTCRAIKTTRSLGFEMRSGVLPWIALSNLKTIPAFFCSI